MTKLIRLDNNSYVNLNNATSFSIEKGFSLRERPCIRKLFWLSFKDFELAKDETISFIVNGVSVFETFTDNESGMRIIQNINSIITSFIRK